jgi:gliding motility-associated-like protein
MKKFFIFLLVLTSHFSHAQIANCPPNIDFEQGTLANWELFTGTCCPINSNVPGASLQQHQIMTVSDTDFYGKFPCVPPGSGNYTLKIGNDNTGSESERARYTLRIPAGLNNYSILYRYAVVFEDPSHSQSEQPRFEVKAIDSATGQVLACADFLYIASSSLPGFSNANVGTDVKFKDWTASSLDLSGNAGKTVFLDFSSGDCSLGGHFGYGYVDVSCGLFQIASNTCTPSANMTFTAPPGFQTYMWYDSTFTTSLGNTQSITIPSPANPTKCYVILTPFTGFGCPDTLEGILAVSNFSVSITSPAQNICKGSTVSLQSTATGINLNTLNYSWTPAVGVSCPTCPVTNAAPQISTSYTLSITDIYNCVQTTVANINVGDVYINQPINKNICSGDVYNGHITTGVYVDSFISSFNCDSIVLLTLQVGTRDTNTMYHSMCDGGSFYGYTTTGIYRDTFTNVFGCDSFRIIHLTVYPNYDQTNNIYLCVGESYFVQGAMQTQPGTYDEFFKTIHGCDSTVTTNIFFTEKVVPVITGDFDLCPGESSTLYVNTFNQLLWSNGNTSSSIVVNSTGWVWVRAQEGNCIGRDSVFVEVHPKPNVQMGISNGTNCKYDDVQLTAFGAKDYVWSKYTLDRFVSNDNPYVFAITQNPTKIFVTGTTQFGCANADSLTLYYTNCCGTIYAPNAFSPNGDNTNELWSVKTDAKKLKEYDLKVYNRFGQIVFESQNLKDQWDGNAKEKPCDTGYYFYLIQAKCLESDEQKIIKGELLLIR